MSKQVSPLAIGTFIFGGLLLLIVAILIFGGGNYFKDKNQFVVFFDSVLNGLNVGAPVKLQGVQIGNVKEISLEIDEATGRIFKPVVIEIDPDRLLDAKGEHLHTAHSAAQNKKNAERLIETGLKARLETQSLLTGLLYVDLNFYHDKPVNLANLNYKDLPELPSVPTTVDELRNTADAIMNKARQLPLEEMVRDLSETLKEMRRLLQSEDTQNALAALAKSLQETQKLTATLNAQTGPLLTNVNGTLNDTRATLADFNRELLPVLKAAEQSLNSATQVLQASQHTLTEVEAMATPDSQLGLALTEMRHAARSLKDLGDSLERHPESLIYGK